MTDLAVIMPVYNEEACIASVVRDWIGVLDGLGIDYLILALNDGSRDATAARLREVAAPHLRIIDKPNEGHGPTILKGYALGADAADWVFQVDSDDEIKAREFPAFWAQRTAYDGLFGVRVGRVQSLGRRWISFGSRALVEVLAGGAVRDANVPFRLMRAACLRPLLACLPPDTFAPNVALAGLFARARCRVINLPVPCAPRRTGTVSLVRWKMWRSALRSLVQVGRILLRHRGLTCAT